MELDPVISSDKPTVLVHNVLINCGYVETARHATVICQHRFGFSDPEEALMHLHKVLKAAYIEALRDYDHYNTIKKADKADAQFDGPQDESFTEEFAEWISEWCGSDNDGSPGGYEPWQVMEANDWEIPGRLTTGMVIDIYENGEHILANPDLIKQHVGAFKGIYYPTHSSNSWPLTSDLRMYVITVGEIKPKEAKKPL